MLTAEVPVNFLIAVGIVIVLLAMGVYAWITKP
jgi:hypothetical protein